MRETRTEPAMLVRLNRIIAASFEAYALAPAANTRNAVRYCPVPGNKQTKKLAGKRITAKVVYFIMGIALGFNATFAWRIIPQIKKGALSTKFLIAQKRFPVTCSDKKEKPVFAGINT